jgi:hypothetical protein
MGDTGNITQMLAMTKAGDDGAWQQLVAVMYADLRRLRIASWPHRGASKR